jgi:predicted nucleotidyltransferase
VSERCEKYSITVDFFAVSWCGDKRWRFLSPSATCHLISCYVAFFVLLSSVSFSFLFFELLNKQIHRSDDRQIIVKIDMIVPERAMTGNVLRNIIDRIAEQFHPRRVILFGSHAAGQSTDQSDVDLLIVCDDSSETRDQAIAIRRSLGDFPVALDIIVSRSSDYERYRGVVNHIAYLADRYGKVVYER